MCRDIITVSESHLDGADFSLEKTGRICGLTGFGNFSKWLCVSIKIHEFKEVIYMKAKKPLAIVLALTIILSTFAATYLPGASAVVTDDDILLDLDFSQYNGEATVADKTGKLTVNATGAVGVEKDGESSMLFDGDKTVQWSTNSYDPFALTDTGVTVSLWINQSDRRDWTQFFSFGKKFEEKSSGLILQATGSCAVRPNLGYYDNWSPLEDNKFTSVNEWIMVTFTQDYDTKVTSAYVNGELALTGIKDFTLKDVALLNVEGQYSLGGPLSMFDLWSGDPKFIGSVKNLTIYSRALTAGEIYQVYDPSSAGNNEAVENTISLIEAIGTPVVGTPECLAKIRAAQAAYDLLSPAEKELVTNYGALFSALDEYALAFAEENDGLTFHMDFENQSLTDTADRVTATKDDSVTFAAGREEGTDAAHFSTVKQGVKWSSDNYDPITLSGDNISLSTWVYFDSQPKTHTTVFMLKSATGGDDGNIIIKAHPDTWSVCVRPIGGTEVALSPMVAPPVGEWVLLTYTQEGTQGKLYVNDELVGSQQMPKLSSTITTSGGFTYSADYALGCQLRWDDPSIPGAMDSFSIYNKTLSIVEIAALYGQSGTDDEAIAAVMEKIDNIGTVELTDASLTLIKEAQAAYNALTDLEKAYVSNYDEIAAAMESYYTLAENANGGKLLYFDFEDEKATDSENRVDAAVSGTTVVDGREAGTKAMQFGTDKTRNDNLYIKWTADEYDPFARTQNGVTISSWIKTSELNDWSTLFSYGKGGNALVIVPQCGFDVRQYGFRVAINCGGVENDIVVDSKFNDTYLGEWTLVTFTQDENKLAKIYINGVESASAQMPNSVYDLAMSAGTTGVNYSLGYVSFFGDNNFQGAMDDFALYNRALSAEEISALMESKADLTDYNLALSEVPSDTTAYTAESVAALNQVLGDAASFIGAGVTVSDQEAVDEWTAKIRTAIAALVNKVTEMSIDISEGMVTTSDVEGKYNITWNAEILPGADTSFDAINAADVEFVSYGVYYAASEEEVNKLIAGETALNAAEFEFGNNNNGELIVYSRYGFRLRAVSANRVRTAVFYLNYEFEGQTYTVLSAANTVTATLAE